MGKVLSLKAVKESAEKVGGEWITPKAGGEFLIYPLRDREFQRKLDDVTERLRKRISAKKGAELPSSEQAEAFFRALVGTKVDGWQNVCGEDDKPLAFTEDNFYETLLQVPGLLEEIANIVAARAQDHRDRVEANLGNS